jgi:hypothetical protein
MQNIKEMWGYIPRTLSRLFDEKIGSRVRSYKNGKHTRKNSTRGQMMMNRKERNRIRNRLARRSRRINQMRAS